MSPSVPEPSFPEPRLGEVLAEILLEEEAGRTPDLTAYLERFPDLAEPLRAYFAHRAWFADEAPCLAPVREGADSGPAGPVETVPHVPAGCQAPTLAAGTRLGGYEVLAELGRGGMGIVYKARQLEPERLVALKVIRTDRLAELPDEERRAWLERFRREAQLVAALDRPAHIVTLYEVGEDQGRPFFTMRLVEGGSLAQRLRRVEATAGAADQRRRAQPDNARLLAKVARAVDYAHQRGILHRDLKPGNILLDAHGEPLVTDFGLARRLDQTGSLVASAIEGSPPYMAPEQATAARGAAVTASDVYSLGAILYEMLTGRPPFQGKDAFDTLLQVVGREPVPPRRLDRRLSRDLETICLKCLQKEPGRRYRSAAELAEDLENWLAGRPINARPAGAPERVWRWCRRNPVPALSVAAVLTMTVTAFALIAASRDEAVTLADQNGRLADANGRLADKHEKEALRANKAAAQAIREEKKAQREATLLAFRQATTLAEQGQTDRAMHALAHGLALAEQAQAGDLEWLFRANLAAWRNHLHSLRRILPHATGVAAVAFSPDGRIAATAAWDRTVRLWDTGSGAQRGDALRHKDWINGLVFSPDGQILLTVAYKTVGVWESTTGRRLADLAHDAIVTSAAFTPDGRKILTGSTDGKLRQWRPSGEADGEPLAHPGWIEAIALSPNGRLWMTGGKEGQIIVWDARTRRPLGALQHPGGVNTLAVSADGRLLLSGGEDRTARLWDLGTGRPQGLPLAHAAAVKAVAFSPDGSLALTGSFDRTARLWDVATAKAVGQPLAHAGEVFAVCFGPDGRTVLTGHGRERGDARMWELALGNPLGAPLSHTGSIVAVAVSRDSKRVATAGRDNTARLWDARTGEPVGGGLYHNAAVNAVVFSRDSQTLVSGGDDSTALYWHAATGEPVTTMALGAPFKIQFGVGHGSTFPGGSFNSARDGRTEPFWGPGRGKSMSRRAGDGGAVFAVAFSPDGKKLVTAGRGGVATLWDAQRGHRVPSMRLKVREKEPRGFDFPRRDAPDLYAAAVSPDGRLIALAGQDGAVQLWDATRYDVEAFLTRAKANPKDVVRLWDEAMAARAAAEPLKHGGPVVALAFSPDSRLLLTGCGDGTAGLWDVPAGKPRQKLKHSAAVVDVAFSPGGKTFVTASWDGAARVWDTATGAAAYPPLLHQGKVLAATFSHDGHTILTGSEDWSARLWDAATGQPVGPALWHQDQVRAVAFRPDGRAALTAGDDRVARLWSLPPPAEGPSERIRVWVEALTGMRRLPDGSVAPLERADWEAAVARLGGPGKEPVPNEDRAGWHRQQARAAEAAGRWQAARWHLDRLIAADPKAGLLYLRRGKAARALGDVAAGRRDFDSAVALLPAEWGSWFQRARFALEEGRAQDALADLKEALARFQATKPVSLRGPGSTGPVTQILHARGSARALLGQWKEAAADLAQVVRNPFHTTTPALRADHALALHKAGDGKGFADACRRMLSTFADPREKPSATIVTTEFGRQEVHRFGKPFDPQAAALLAWVCCLAPEALPDFSDPLRLAGRAASLDKKSYPFARAYGAALYRAGKYEEAVGQLNVARQLRESPSPSVWLFLAMAHHRCQRPEQAREWLARARSWIADARKRAATPLASPPGISWERLPWTERVALELLQREAEKLIQGDTSRR
jgi:WD40 repeat protein/tetratricopeptide (TPR) repeat protein